MNVSNEVLDLIYGMVGVSLFLFRNPYRKNLAFLSIFIVGLFLSQILFLSISNLTGTIIYGISAFGLLIAYIDRFNRRQQKNVIDFLKIAGILLLIVYPFPFYNLFDVGRSIFWIASRDVTFFVLFTIYFYDRWILKPSPMKKKFLIVLVVQSVIIFLMIIYSSMQRAQLDSTLQIARENKLKAIKAETMMHEWAVKHQDLLDSLNNRAEIQ